jgi:haloalkane dehalogenase
MPSRVLLTKWRRRSSFTPGLSLATIVATRVVTNSRQSHPFVANFANWRLRFAPSCKRDPAKRKQLSSKAGLGSETLSFGISVAVMNDVPMIFGYSKEEGEASMISAKKEREPNVIAAALPYEKGRRRVLDREMAYVEVGQGDPIVFLHGNPTSSYLWRNVLPHLKPLGRCIAPDLIGMGDSDKLPDSGPNSYRFVEHRRYLDALLEALDVHDRVSLVVHDWGSALGFDWANRHREAVKGIAFMEAIVAPQGADHWDNMGMRSALVALRSQAGEAMVLENNYFIEEILPKAILRKLSEEEMAEYRRPFAEPGEGRRPTLTWPRQIPIEGEPADVHAIATDYADWLRTSNVPKLFLKVEPGAILTNDTLLNLVRRWPALTEKTVAGIHFVQEDSPDEIGRAIAGWMSKL